MARVSREDTLEILNDIGITTLFHSFLEYLQKEKEKIALLQLTGKIEEYLTKEFIYYLHTSSNGSRFALTNLGNTKTDKRRIDICILKSEEVIDGFIEVKYLRNRHRNWEMPKFSAKGEITPTLKSLKRQLGAFNLDEFADYPVSLSSKTKSIYGLVFASYVRKESDEDGKEDFYQTILKRDITNSFRDHGSSKAQVRPIYDDVKVKVFNTDYFVTLRAGLWKLRGK